jgi:hypothetical protein
MQITPTDNSAAMTRVSPAIAQMPLAMILGTVLALVAYLALPWVDDVPLVRFAVAGIHEGPMAYVLIGAAVLGLVVAVTSLKKSRRWLTAPTALVLLVPTLLPPLINHAQLGAKVSAIGSLIALVAAVAMTVKPVRN